MEEVEVPAPLSPMQQIEVQVRETLGIRGTNLMVNEIMRISVKIPSTAIGVGAAVARELACSFLKGSELCGELLAMSAAYEEITKINQKSTHSKALLVKANTAGYKTASDKSAYADTDDEFQKSYHDYIKAKMFRTLIENKKEAFDKAHYLMRKISETESPLSNELGVEDTNSELDGDAISSSRANTLGNTSPQRVPWNTSRRDR
jgi:hypothetical protein